MNKKKDPIDILVVGAGPIGIACGVEATLSGLDHVIIEKGCLTDAVYQFPKNLVFFSTADLLELADIPFLSADAKPTRAEILNYYKRIAQYFKLETNLFEEVREIKQEGDVFSVTTSKRNYLARKVVLAIGFYDHPKMMNIPGEDLPKVSHFYQEPHSYYLQKVVVVGGGNSAVESALELYRGGAKKVTVVHRHENVNASVKYWIRPDFINRVKEGSIEAYFNSRLTKITENSVVIERDNGEELEIENDFVLAMTGYHTDFDFLKKVGVRLDSEQKRPAHDEETMETNVPGVYIAGVATGGMNTNRIFIENGRVHAKRIMKDILKKMGRKV